MQWFIDSEKAMPVPKNLSTALLRVSSASGGVIDSESGTITGVKVMELGKLAQFEGENGQPKTIRITAKHIDALLKFAGNRSVPAHLTHDWFSGQGKAGGDTIEVNSRVGALRNFRKDGEGNLIADAVLKDGQARNDILWAAQYNPEDTMLSAVFSYAKDDPQCIPVNIRAVDFVPCGASTTALFSELNPDQNSNAMTIEELVAMLQDPAVVEAVKAIIKTVEASQEAAEPSVDEVAAMESDAGVTDEDKKPEDEQKPALMRAYTRISRAITRKAKALETSETAILGKAKVQAAAEATALLGKGKFIRQGEGDTTADAESFITAQMSAGCPNRATAIARMGKDKPELYATFRGYTTV